MAADPIATHACDDACPFDVYREWWVDIAPRRAVKTARLYRYQVHRFLADVGRDYRHLSRGDIGRYLDDITPQHAESVRSALADFYSFCVRHGHIAADPLADVRVARTRGRIRRGLDEPELAQLLVAARYLGHSRFRWSDGGEWLAWVILAHANTGVRPGELLRLTAEDVYADQAKPFVRVWASKTRTERAVPLNATARAAFGELLKRRPIGRLIPWGTTQYGSKIRRAAMAAGLAEAKCRAYALRHTFATRLVERGVHTRYVAELLGHVDARHMWTYSQPSEGELHAAVAALDM